MYHTLTQRAVQLLQKKGKGDGSFLIRPNSRRPGYYALTLMYNSQPYHYEVVCEVRGVVWEVRGWCGKWGVW